MEALKRIRYFTANCWNLSTAPAYNLKVYKVINRELRDKVFDLMEADGFYDEINLLIRNFEEKNNYEWQAGFNGRSGGYLVLYRGGKRPGGRVFSYPGKGIEDAEVPAQVLKDFRRLAIDIVKVVEYMAKNNKVEEETYIVEKTFKFIV